MVSNSQNNQFYKSELDLEPMTLVLKLDLDMVKMYHHTKNEISMSRHSKVIARTDTETDKQYENITLPHTRTVIMEISWPVNGITPEFVNKARADPIPWICHNNDNVPYTGMHD